MTFNEGNFQSEVLESSVPVLVDFWAPWCRPCHSLATVIESLFNIPDVKIGKVNIEEEPGLADSYAITAVPTILFFNKGQLVKRMIGLQNETILREVIESLK